MSLNQLTKNYSDSEEEKEYREDNTDSYSTDTESPPNRSRSRSASPNSQEEPLVKKKKITPNTLVSYSYIEEDNEQGDDGSDKEELDEILKSVPMDTESEEEIDYGVKFPPQPTAKCPDHLQEKINMCLKKVEKDGRDYNVYINQIKAFRNPSIYEKLINHMSLDELGSNYPVELQDCYYGPESYYDELSKTQNEYMEKREKEKKAKQAENNSKSQSQSSEDEVKKRKTRFDQGISVKTTVPATTTKSTSSTKSTTSDSSKSSSKTTISAFGPLARRSK